MSRSGLLLPVEYLRNGKRYSSFDFTVANGKSHATKRCNPRLCCCYRFWDIVVANIKNFKIFDFDVKFARATWYMPSNEFARHNNKNKKNKNKEISRSGLSLPVEYLRNGKRYSSFVFTLNNGKSHATKRCNPGLCSCYHFWDIVVANIKNFKIFHFDENLLEQICICRRTSSRRHNNKNKETSRSGLFFRSNISETVGDIRVLFSLWPRAIVALPNVANDVSVVHIVFEIWSRQHQNFGMLTCTSERNQYPFEWIRTAN